jgi:hypothetical protein
LIKYHSCLVIMLKDSAAYVTSLLKYANEI